MSKILTPELIKTMEDIAQTACANAYAPYSRFLVGAALLTESGRIFAGCNVENAAYGPGNCAERTAIFSAIASGERNFSTILIYTPTEKIATPCGICRQVINEFNPDCLIISTCQSNDRKECLLKELLPFAFGPKNLLEVS